MKRYIVAILLFFTTFFVLSAQDKGDSHLHLPEEEISSSHTHTDSLSTHHDEADTSKVEVPNIYVWKITPRLGERIFVPRDTVLSGFHQSMLVDGQGVAIGYLGNIGSPVQSKVFFERPETSRFTFLDGMKFWRKNPEDQYFMNTKVPYSNVKYQNGGGGANAEQRFQAEMSMNMGKKLNVGFDFDYIYARGLYTSLSNKHMSYDFYASYIGDKYKMHAFAHNNNFVNIENGGIAHLDYITNPDSEDIADTGTRFRGTSKDIPVNMQNTWNKMRGRHIYVTNRYDLGNDMEEYQANDTTKAWRKKVDYVPLASAILTTHYTDQRRRITSDFVGLDNLYKPYENIEGDLAQSPKYNTTIEDYTSYYSFKNTFALAMNEGFRSWTKFGLTAFVEYDMRKYSIPGKHPRFQMQEGENALFIGGVLSKEKGNHLKYKASVAKDILNNDFRLEGEVTTILNVLGKNVSAKANAYIKNTSPSFFEEHFSSKYWNWNADFDNVNRVFVGGEINLPEFSSSKTRISGGVENVTNYIYYNQKGLPQQKSGNTQVISLRLDQDLKAGIFHWDNKAVYQMTSDNKVIPLPELSVYSNIYLMTKIAKVLTLQLGVDAHFHTKYYMPGYEPLTMQFYNQRNVELGNFPVTTAYVNLHLKYTRFFITMYNLTDGMGNKESFSLYKYPVNPRVLKIGLSWQFNN